MKIIAMLSFFDEDPSLLRECISRLAAIGVDQVVAIDGPYDLYPTEKIGSSFDTTKAIIDSCGGKGKPDLIMRNKSGWEGNEVEKRNFMLEVALEAAEEGDWLLVVDSDHLWQESDSDLKTELASCRDDVHFAEVAFAESRLPSGSPFWYEATLLMRAIPGMKYVGAHWRVHLPGGITSSTLRAGDGGCTAQSKLQLQDKFKVWHAVYDQPEDRRKRQATYYDGRDAGEGIER